MQITKEFKFEMAHKLSKSYTCKCQHIHGHSYRALVTIKHNALNDENVVVDFTKVKEILNPLIELLDHNLIIHKDDSACDELTQLAEKHGIPLIISRVNPTAEFLAGLICCHLAESINGFFCSKFAKTTKTGFEDIEVEVFETATSSAKVSFNELDSLNIQDSGFSAFTAFSPKMLTLISSKLKKD